MIDGEDLVGSSYERLMGRLDGSRYLQDTVFSSTQSIEEVPDVLVPDTDRTVSDGVAKVL